MKLKVITPDTTLWRGTVTSINIADKEGAFTVLKGHAPLITVVKDIVATIRTSSGELSYIATDSGTFKVLNDEISLIVDYGAVSPSKEEARINLVKIKDEITKSNNSLGDDTIANLETQLMKMTQEL